MKAKLDIYNYSISNESENELDLFVDGAIVDAETQEWYNYWGDTTSVSFRSIREEILKSSKKTINIWINSTGGHVGDAMAIHDWIVNCENNGLTINTNGVGMICSAATYILSASKNSKISKNSYYMIHNVSGAIYGTVNEIENYAVSMRKFNDTIENYYANLTGKSNDQIKDWMNAETWFTGTEAVSNGFVKNLIENQNFTNKINSELFPFKNKSALNFYNSFVQTKEDFNPQNLDMNKFVEAILNGLKKEGFLPSNDSKEVKPITESGLTNALSEAFKDIKTEPTEEQISNSVTNFFEKGLPENIANQIGTAVTEATKEFATNAKIIELETELLAVKDSIINSKGGIKPPKNAGESTSKYEHEGIGFSE